MTAPWEHRLREDLRGLADAPAPAGGADRALANARKLRRRRAVLSATGSVALAALIAIPVINGIPGDGWRLPFMEAPGAATCETATDEADPPEGVPKRDYPHFVEVVLTKLPSRDDYTLQSAHGICADLPGARPNGYAVINLGPNRERGHLTVTLHYDTRPRTCEAMNDSGQERLFCEEGTDSTPIVLGWRIDADSFTVTAVHPDTRAVTIESLQTPLDVAAVRSAVTDPDVADLLP